MAFDGLFLSAVVNEIKIKALNAKVDKIFIPSKDEIVINFRSFGENLRLLISANPSSARMHFTTFSRENPAVPPVFCMILRKHLTSAKLIDIKQISLERVAILTFSCFDDFGEPTEKHLIAEIMGKHSNIIFTDKDFRIIDSIKRVDFTVSALRQILPNMKYTFPPIQNKASLLDDGFDFNLFLEENKEKKLDKALLNTFLGFSPLITRELSFLCSRQNDILTKALTDSEREKLLFFLKSLKDNLLSKSYNPVMLANPKTKNPSEFYFLNILQYGTDMLTVQYESFGTLLDAFYEKKENAERLKQKSTDILRVLTQNTDRLTRKIAAQKEDLLEYEKKETFLLFADLISANIYRIQKGEQSVTLSNFYEEGEEIEIPLYENKTAAENAQIYYKEYKKAKTAKQKTLDLIQKSNEELEYLETVFDGLAKSESENELNELRQELYDNGFIQKPPTKKAKKQQQVTYMEFLSSDGFKIIAGKNNIQNDLITTKIATKTDLWFHIKHYAGSHTVILRGQNGIIPDRTIEQAAKIAAFYSRASKSSNIAVDYTEIKNVKKPSGAKCGMVIYESYKTAFVLPNEDEIIKLKQSYLEDKKL